MRSKKPIRDEHDLYKANDSFIDSYENEFNKNKDDVDHDNYNRDGNAIYHNRFHKCMYIILIISCCSK